MKTKLTEKQVADTLHLSQRQAAKVLGVGKTTIQKARKRWVEDAATIGEEQVYGRFIHVNANIAEPDASEAFERIIPKAPEFYPTPPGAAESPVTHESIEDELQAAGVTEATHRLTYGFSEWDMADGTKGKSRRVTAVPIPTPDPADEVDPHELLAKAREIQAAAPITLEYAGKETFVISFNDWQYGKKTRQGKTEDTIQIVLSALEAAKARIKQLEKAGYQFGELVIIFGGDLVEGCTIYPNMSFSLEMARRQQIEGCITLGLTILDELAPTFDKVQVLGVRGNHGENRIDGNKTTAEDNDDTHVVAMMKLAAERDPSLQHVNFTVANDEAGVTHVTNTGWIIGTTHGDVYGKGVSGSTVERKVNTWYKNMSAGRDPLGCVDVMVTHHYHHKQSADYGSWEWHQTPAQDGALSEYFRQSTGNYSEPGVLSFVMGEERYMEEKILK